MEVTTSEEIKEEVEKVKNTRKAKYATSSNDLVKMKTVLSHYVPSQVNSLFNLYDYMLYKNDNEEKAINSEEEAEAMIQKCKKFMEAVVVMEDVWFFTTAFSVFVLKK